MKIVENMLIRYSNGKTIRVVYYNRISSIIYAIDLGCERWPYPIKEDELLNSYEDGKAEIVKDSICNNVFEDDLSKAEKKRRDYAWEIVMFTLKQVDDEEKIFISKYRQTAIRKTINRYDISYSSVRNYMVRYWKGGKIINALLPKFRLIGGKGEEKKAGIKKRGRPRKLNSDQGINVDESIKKIIKVGLNRYYYNDKQNSLKTAYELTIRDFFTEEVVQNGVKTRILKDTSKLPSYNQFRYWFKKFNDPKKEVTSRLGTRIFHQKYRGITGNSTQDAGLGPGTLWQTDSTPLDVHCVSSIDRNILVGNPLLHLVIDVYSRLIVGFSLSFESLNAYSGAMMALYNSMTDKKEFCKRFGIEIKDEWDVACIPQRILTDRGELDGRHIENAIENLGISVQNSPPYRPETKAIVEQSFNQITQRLKPHVDGAIIGNKLRERGEVDHRLKASLTIDELTKILIRCIIFYNNHHVLNEYELDESMLEAGIEKIPRQIWEFGLKSQKGNLRTLSEDIIKLHLLPVDSGLVTARGVKYKKMLYASEYSLKNNWFQKARSKSWKINIWYDPRNLSEIYTVNEADQSIHKLHLLEHLTKYQDRGIDEIKSIIDYEKVTDSQSMEKELKEKMKLFDDIERIVEEGREKTKRSQDESISKTRKLMGIKENQRREREFHRKLDQREVEDNLIELENLTENEPVDELYLFRELQGLEGDEEY